MNDPGLDGFSHPRCYALSSRPARTNGVTAPVARLAGNLGLPLYVFCMLVLFFGVGFTMLVADLRP